MRKKSFNLFAICLLSLLAIAGGSSMLLSLGGEDAKAQHIVKGKHYVNPTGDEFPIGAWDTFFSNIMPADSCFKQVRDAGINIGSQWVADTTLMQQVLEKAREYDMKMVFASSSIGTMSKLPSTVTALRNDPALLGYYVSDEPKVKQFAACREYKDSISKYDPDAVSYLNLLAAWDGAAVGADSFQDYVKRFIEEVDPGYLCIDIYPVRTNGGLHILTKYYATYEVFSSMGKIYGLPFWAYVDSTALEPMQWPDETNMRFAAFVPLAYGAQGILWWTYTFPASNNEDWKESPVMPGGRRTKIWYDMQTVNREIQAQKDVFLGSELLGVWHTGDKLPEGTKRLQEPPAPFTSLSAGKEGVLVSHLRTHGREYMMIVNHDVANSQDVDLRWRGRGLRRVMSDGSETGQLSRRITLPAGGYAIYRLK